MSDPSRQRDLAFRKIQTTYQTFYQRLNNAQERLPYRSTKSGMWATSVAEEVYRGFCHFQLDKYGQMADLGSGDGIVVLIASLFTQATGYEIDAWLHEQSIELRNSLNLFKATFIQADFLRANLSGHDLLYLYPDKPFDDLEERLHSTWRGRLLINGPHFPPRRFKKVVESPASVGRFALYESL
jgi:hypothetical protein